MSPVLELFRTAVIVDASYVGNSLRFGYGQNYDINAVRPLTTWTPQGGAVQRFRDPTTAAGFYSTNLIRSMVGLNGFGAVPLWTYNGTNNYHALQVQLNRRFGKLQWNANYTWSRTTVYEIGQGTQWVDNNLMKNVVNRPHAVNFNMGYELPKGSNLWSNWFTKAAFDGWKVNGNGAIFSGTPYSVGCGAINQPAGYWTGTPTGGIPFRCQMGNDLYLPAGQFPSRTEDPKLQVPFNQANFVLPAIDSLGIGNTPPTLRYGPGLFNLDLSMAKQFQLGKVETRTLEVRAETFNTLNHFNPNNPNTGLTYNFTTGAQTNASFGTIGGAQVQARRVILSMRIRF